LQLHLGAGVPNYLFDVNFAVLYPAIVLLVGGAAEFGAWLGGRSAGGDARDRIGVLTGSALGLLALLLAFNFSLALSRYDARRAMVVEEANVIGNTADFALMLPQPAQAPILALLHEYIKVRTGLGVPYDPAKLDQGIARSLDLQTMLWQRATALTAGDPQALPVYRFVGSLNEMRNVQVRRLSAVRNHVPGEIILLLVGTAMVAIGFAGYQISARATTRVAEAIMSLLVATVIIAVVDLDRPARGLIQVSVRPLLDAERGIPDVRNVPK
jgi:hypothetical protein